MFKSLNFLNMDNYKIKYFLILILIFSSFFLAFNHHPPIIALWEGAEIYKDFLPTKNPALILSISEDPVTTGPFNTFGYASLMISRYLSDFFGHSLSIIRLPSIIYGLITLFLFYVIVDRWFGWKIALISIFLLSTNQYFLMFQHFLLPQMISLTTILLTIERFQNLLLKKNNFSIISFGFVCALTTLHYYTARFCMVAILLFYVVDFDKFSIWKYKTYTQITNIKRVQTIFLVFLSMVFFLTLFYPGNLFLLFNYDFIFPTVRVGEYSKEFLKSLYNIWHNLGYFFNYFVFNKSNFPSDIMVHTPYALESLIIIFLSIFGIIFSLLKKISYQIIFILYILFITLFLPLLSETNNSLAYESSVSLSVYRYLFSIPFICLISVLGLSYFYKKIKSKKYNVKLLFVFLIAVFFCFRTYGYFNEIKRFERHINSYNIDFSQPAISDGIVMPRHPTFEKLRELHYNQIYYYRLAEFVTEYLKINYSDSNKMKLLFIPEEFYTPFNYLFGSGNIPWKGHPYYFAMYLTFYLQENNINASYLVDKSDVKETFLRKVITVLDRYKNDENLNDHYPRNKTQERIVKVFVYFVSIIEKNKYGKIWINSIRNQTDSNINTKLIGNFFVNTTSNKKPTYLLVTNKEQLNLLKKNKYKLVLSLPIL